MTMPDPFIKANERIILVDDFGGDPQPQLVGPFAKEADALRAIEAIGIPLCADAPGFLAVIKAGVVCQYITADLARAYWEGRVEAMDDCELEDTKAPEWVLDAIGDDEAEAIVAGTASNLHSERQHIAAQSRWYQSRAL